MTRRRCRGAPSSPRAGLARWRVPLGFAAAGLVLWLAQPDASQPADRPADRGARATAAHLGGGPSGEEPRGDLVGTVPVHAPSAVPRLVPHGAGPGGGRQPLGGGRPHRGLPRRHAVAGDPHRGGLPARDVRRHLRSVCRRRPADRRAALQPRARLRNKEYRAPIGLLVVSLFLLWRVGRGRFHRAFPPGNLDDSSHRPAALDRKPRIWRRRFLDFRPRPPHPDGHSSRGATFSGKGRTRRRRSGSRRTSRRLSILAFASPTDVVDEVFAVLLAGGG